MTDITPFPDGMRGAVSLTFDDGMASHLETVVPMLDDLGIRATFYLNPRDSSRGAGDWEDRLRRWREASEGGNEIGNHTLSHLCSRAMASNPAARGLETIGLTEIDADILEAENRLDSVLGRKARSFAYPCYLAYVGEGESRESFVPVVARHFIAARGRAPGGALNHPDTCVMHYLYSYACERMSGAELIGLAARALMRGGWSILTFHGVNEGHLPISAVDLRELCEYLTRFNPGLWTAPVIDVAQRIGEWRQAQMPAR